MVSLTRILLIIIGCLGLLVLGSFIIFIIISGIIIGGVVGYIFVVCPGIIALCILILGAKLLLKDD